MAASQLQRVVGVVTGGASGLGRATVEKLVRNGARVVIADLPSSDGETVAKELGENCAFVPTDVSTLQLTFVLTKYSSSDLLLLYSVL